MLEKRDGGGEGGLTVAWVVLVRVGSGVGEKDFAGGTDVGKGVENVGDLRGREVHRLVVTAVDAPVGEVDEFFGARGGLGGVQGRLVQGRGDCLDGEGAKGDDRKGGLLEKIMVKE